MLKLAHVFLALGIALFPIYAFPSGGIQISHALLACYFGFYILARGFGNSDLDIAMLVLTGMVFARESLAVMAGAPVSELVHPLYLLFNFLLVSTVTRSAVQLRVADRLFYVVVAAGVIAVVGAFIFGFTLVQAPGLERPVGTFNNPNQIGYFSICLLSMFLLYVVTGKASPKISFALLVIPVFLAVISLSKAAIISCLFGILMAGPAFRRDRVILLIGAVVVISLVTVGFHMLASGALDHLAFVSRLQNIGQQSDDSLAARGYDALANASWFEVLFGLGHAGVVGVVGHEIHSTIFSFFGTYGLVGGALFLSVLFIWVRTIFRTLGWTGVFAVAFPPILFGVAHNGSRFTMFWLLMALSVGMCRQRERKSETHTMATERIIQTAKLRHP